MKLLASLAAVLIMGIASALGNVPDLWVLVGEFTGLDSAPRYVGLYAKGSMRVRYDMPFSSAEARYGTYRRVRDLVQDPDGTVWTLSGIEEPILTRIDLAGNRTDRAIPGLSLRSQAIRGGLAVSGRYAYFTYNSLTYHNGFASAIVRVDLEDLSVICFADGLGALDVAVQEGLVYAMTEDGWLKVYDEVTLFPVQSLRLEGRDHYGIAILGDGCFLTTGRRKEGDVVQSVIRRLSPSGKILASIDVPVSLMGDIDVDLDGRVVASTVGSGLVLVTDTLLSRHETFMVTDSRLGGDMFVAFATVVPPISAPAELTEFIVSNPMIPRRTGLP